MKKLFVFCSVIFFLLLAVFVFDVSYLFHGIRCTYLRGESSAQIDDHRFFYTREVVSKNPLVIPDGYNYVDSVKNKKLNTVLEESNSVAFLVVQDDSVRVEKYWEGGGKEVLTNSFSMAKSIMSILVGCAIDDGYIKSVDQSVFDFIPELEPFKKNDVKIKHLLEMSSGYDWLENYKRPISVTAKAYYGRSLLDLILNRDFVGVPGKDYFYSSGSTQVLGLVLERAVGESLSSYAGWSIWSRIGATQNALWALDKKDGFEKAFCCFNSSARDFLKIGLLMLGDGVVDWVEQEAPPLVFKQYYEKYIKGGGSESSVEFWKKVSKNKEEESGYFDFIRKRGMLKPGVSNKEWEGWLDGSFSSRVLSKNYIDWLLSVPKLLDPDGAHKKDGFVDYYSNGWWVARVLEKDVFYARGFLGQYIVVIPDLNLVFVRLGMFENEKSAFKNDYMLTDNLLFFIQQVIYDFS